MIAWNPEGQKTSAWLSIPVSGAAYTVTDLATKATVPAQATALDNRTLDLPLLYLNKYKMKAAEVASQQAALANKATHALDFEVSLPPVGFSSFSVKKSAASAESTAVTEAAAKAPSTVSNGVYEISEKDAKLAQKLGHLQLFLVYSHRNAWANLHMLGQPDTSLAIAINQAAGMIESVKNLASGVSTVRALRGV